MHVISYNCQVIFNLTDILHITKVGTLAIQQKNISADRRPLEYTVHCTVALALGIKTEPQRRIKFYTFNICFLKSAPQR